MKKIYLFAVLFLILGTVGALAGETLIKNVKVDDSTAQTLKDSKIGDLQVSKGVCDGNSCTYLLNKGDLFADYPIKVPQTYVSGNDTVSYSDSEIEAMKDRLVQDKINWAPSYLKAKNTQTPVHTQGEDTKYILTDENNNPIYEEPEPPIETPPVEEPPPSEIGVSG